MIALLSNDRVLGTKVMDSERKAIGNDVPAESTDPAITESGRDPSEYATYKATSATNGTAPRNLSSSMNVMSSAAHSLLASSLTDEQKAFVASRMSGVATSTPLPAVAPLTNGIDARQILLNRVRQQEKELEFLRAQAQCFTAAPAPAFSSVLGSRGGNTFMFPPELQSAALSNQSDVSRLFLPNATAPGLHTVNTAIRSPESFSLPDPTAQTHSVDTHKGNFPLKLHQMLAELEKQPNGASIASFLPHGKSFAIHKPREFVRHVMPKYFRMSRFSSFQRQLNLYDFERVSSGVDRGAYRHDFFVYGEPGLTAHIKRNKIKGDKSKNLKKNRMRDSSNSILSAKDQNDKGEYRDDESEGSSTPTSSFSLAVLS